MDLIAKRPAKAYTCSQAALYAGLELAWKSQLLYDSAFAAENSQYVPGLAAAKIAAIEAAQRLPGGHISEAKAESKRILLLAKLGALIDRWNWLKRYIRKAYKGNFYKPMIMSAGKAQYKKAYNMNWECALSLGSAAQTFIAKHSAELMSDGGMPAGFPAGFATVNTEFAQLYADYMKARQFVFEETDAKILANNAIYADGRAMMEDGKHIFRMQAAIRYRFTWEKILKLLGDGHGEKKGEAVEAGHSF